MKPVLNAANASKIKPVVGYESKQNETNSARLAISATPL
jgi:hypothetical protein